MEQQQRIDNCRRRWEGAPRSRLFAPLADELRSAGRHEEALSVLDEGLALHPEFTGGLLILGRTLLEADRGEMAGRVLERVVELDPGNVMALELLYGDAAGRDDAERALGLARRLAALDPDDDRWPEAVGRWEQAAATPEPEPAAAAEGAEPAFATLTLVDIYLAQGYRRNAVQALEQMLAAAPDREDVRQRLEELRHGDADGGDGAEAPEPAAASLARRSDKRQFAAWVERLLDETETRP